MNGRSSPAFNPRTSPEKMKLIAWLLRANEDALSLIIKQLNCVKDDADLRAVVPGELTIEQMIKTVTECRERVLTLIQPASGVTFLALRALAEAKYPPITVQRNGVEVPLEPEPPAC